jgi:hypothetical protein
MTAGPTSAPATAAADSCRELTDLAANDLGAAQEDYARTVVAIAGNTGESIKAIVLNQLADRRAGLALERANPHGQPSETVVEALTADISRVDAMSCA